MRGFSDYGNYDALGLAELVKNGEISPVDLLEEAKMRLGEVNPKLNAVTYMADELAGKLLERLNKDTVFCGVPFLVKDLMLPFKGVPLSNGIKGMKNYVPAENGPLAKQINASGLITFGKTTTSELGASPIAKSEAFGETLNPWDVTKNSGGSSGGSSVAVATRIVPMAYASDGGGSIRLPASYCGIFGLKPSQWINRFEDMANAWGGAVVSHVATISVRDSAAYLDMVAGNVDDNYSVSNPKEDSYLYSVTRAKKKLKIGLITEAPTKTAVHPECIKAAEMAGNVCERIGHEVIPAKWNFDGRVLLREFMKIILYYTYRDVIHLSALLGKNEKRLDLELNSKLIALAGSGISSETIEKSFDVMKMASQSIAELHRQFDLILTPTVATPPLGGDELDPSFVEKLVMKVMVFTGLGKHAITDKVLDMGIDNTLYSTPFTPIANITGQPAMSVPLYWDCDNLPHGAHFMADVGNDRTLFMLARQLEVECPWVNKVPNGIN
jgi:amidase